MAEVALRPPPSAFPRPTSLYLPQLDSTPALVRASSYSPFPTIAGASHDPHGLDKFLLSPEDPAWLYSDPLAAATIVPPNDEPVVKPKALKKVRSFSMLHRSSPLSQSSTEPDSPVRKRSNSVDSVASVDLPAVDTKPEPKKKPSMFRRKSSVLDDLSFSVDPSTPMSSRSNSAQSVVSSASSSSSSEGVKTPSETAPEVEIAGTKLAVALAAAGAATDKGKKGSWRGWLGGKRSAKVRSASGSGAVTPAESPDTSVVDASLPQVTLTPSPDIATPDHGPIIDQMRRLSYAKLGQLRNPSPHPLALTLKRQYSNLPDEVAMSIQSGKRVFPLSVNAHDRSNGLMPMQGGMITSLGVRSVLRKLDRGECPDAAPRTRRRSDPMIVRRPRGVLDFVDRAPFEERNIVLYPNGTYSPISMARPGYGVWDLDFSAYILALSQVDSLPGMPWPNMPRASMGPDVLPVLLPSPDSEVEEVLVSPTPVVVELVEESGVESPVKTASGSPVKLTPEPPTQLAPTVQRDSPVPSLPVSKEERHSRTESSFKPLSAEKIVASWNESSDEEEEDDDEEPLAMLVKKPTNKVAARPVSTREQTTSMPAKRVSISLDEETKKQLAMAEVARARERRAQNASGETERRAEAERHRSSYKRASSAVDLTSRRMSTANTSSSTLATQTASPQHHRRRTQSTYEDAPRPSTTRVPSAPAGLPTKRYHSFYEAQPSHARSSPMPVAQQLPIAQPAYFAPAYPSYPMGYAPMPAYAQPMMHPPAYLPHSSSLLSLAVPSAAHLNPHRSTSTRPVSNITARRHQT